MSDLLTVADKILFVHPHAERYGLDAALVCAVIEQESGWNPWAVRFEPAFYLKYVAPQKLGDATESQARSISWGLMQVMGQVARESGFAGRFLAELCDPDVGVEVGCKVLAAKIRLGGNPRAGLLRWNGGANPQYPDQVTNRMAQYQGKPSQ